MAGYIPVDVEASQRGRVFASTESEARTW